MTKLKQFTPEELCEVGEGAVLHIRSGNKALCGKGAVIDAFPSPISVPIFVREDYYRLCKRCLAIYRKRKGLKNA